MDQREETRSTTHHLSTNVETQDVLAIALTITRQELLLSYHVSQGSSAVQRWIFRWVHHVRPDAQLSEAQQAELFAQSYAPARALVSRPQRHLLISHDIAEELTDEIRMLAMCLE